MGVPPKFQNMGDIDDVDKMLEAAYDGSSKEKTSDRKEDSRRDSRRDRDREGDRRRERSRDRDSRRDSRRDRSRDRDSRRDSRRDDRRDSRRDDRAPPEPQKSEKQAERDATEANLSAEEKLALDADRDLRTVFVYQLSVKATEDDVFELMSNAGKVRDVRLITDRYTRKCKGFGYVEFYEREAIPKAISLSGTVMRGVPVMVKFSEAEKNIAAQQERLIQTQQNQGPLRLYVGNLHSHVSEKDLEAMFSPFGPLDSVQLHKDPVTGQPKGFAFVNYRNAEDGRMALQQLNGYEIAGMAIKVGMVNETAATGGPGADDALDDTEGGGMQLTAQSRAMLMARLQRDPNAVQAQNTPAPAPAAVPNDGLNHDPGCTVAPMAQCTILLRNMFDPKTETDPNFDMDIKEDVTEECGKFGRVKHIAVTKNSPGFVFVRFDSQQAATAAKDSLAGRWFAGKMITADYILEGSYGLKFPESNM